MRVVENRYIWMNGRFVPWAKAQVHVLTHALHYGSSWFEGIRAYKTRRGTAIFRLEDHMRRLANSCKIYSTDLPYTVQELCSASVELLQRNGLRDCYIRPLVFRGYGEMGVTPFGCPVEVVIAAWKWGRYLVTNSTDEGVDVCVSSWTRLHSNTMPALAKASANYLNSQLVRVEALRHGYDEGLSLDPQGYISEGSGENIFIVHGGVLYTPPLASSILVGITRASVLTLAEELAIPLVEQVIPRAMLYVADEIFLTGTAAEIVPVRSVDRITIGTGKIGPITKSIIQQYHRIIHDGEDPHGWLTFVNFPKARTSKRQQATRSTNSK